MPQELVLMYHTDTGEPKRFHSVDAAEAYRLGDYTFEAPKGKELSPEQMAQADFGMRAAQGTIHPELMTPEQREEQRRQANEEAARQAAQPVVLHAGGQATVSVSEPVHEVRRTESRQAARREAEEKK